MLKSVWGIAGILFFYEEESFLNDVYGTSVIRCVSECYGAKVEYRQSQSRMLEPVQEVFVKPLVVDLQVLSETRQKATWPFPDVKVTEMTVGDVETMKANALYLTAQNMTQM